MPVKKPNLNQPIIRQNYVQIAAYHNFGFQFFACENFIFNWLVKRRMFSYKNLTLHVYSRGKLKLLHKILICNAVDLIKKEIKILITTTMTVSYPE